LDRAVNLVNGKIERFVLHECGQKRRRVRQKNQYLGRTAFAELDRPRSLIAAYASRV